VLMCLFLAVDAEVVQIAIVTASVLYHSRAL